MFWLFQNPAHTKCLETRIQHTEDKILTCFGSRIGCYSTNKGYNFCRRIVSPETRLPNPPAIIFTRLFLSQIFLFYPVASSFI
jgi:hypothetical protein